MKFIVRCHDLGLAEISASTGDETGDSYGAFGASLGTTFTCAFRKLLIARVAKAGSNPTLSATCFSGAFRHLRVSTLL
jgi:hypothetical protein